MDQEDDRLVWLMLILNAAHVHSRSDNDHWSKQIQLESIFTSTYRSNTKKVFGPTETRTPVTGFRVLGATDYTMEPQHTPPIKIKSLKLITVISIIKYPQ